MADKLPQQVDETKKRSIPHLSYIVISASLVIILLCTLVGYGIYLQFQQKVQSQNLEELSTLFDQTPILEKIASKMTIPKDETPQMLKITDSNKMPNQPFLTRGKTGDILVIFSKNRIAILYDPKTQEILQSGPLILTATTSAYFESTRSAIIQLSATPKPLPPINL